MRQRVGIAGVAGNIAEEVDKIYVATNKKFEDDFKDFLSSRENNNYELIIESQEKEEEKPSPILRIQASRIPEYMDWSSWMLRWRRFRVSTVCCTLSG